MFNQKSLFIKPFTFKSGLSNYHKVLTTILRKTLCKVNPKTIFYRDYKSFVTSDFVTIVTLCNHFPSHFVIITEWTLTKDPGPVVQDP